MPFQIILTCNVLSILQQYAETLQHQQLHQDTRSWRLVEGITLLLHMRIQLCIAVCVQPGIRIATNGDNMCTILLQRLNGLLQLLRIAGITDRDNHIIGSNLPALP